MLAKTPPMGWNSWNTFGNDICEKVVLETADAMVETGLKDAGYEYVVIDDCWSLMERGADGRITADPAKFPNGMKYVADYVHSKGLKFGMYSCAGDKTCNGNPGSFDHEFLDAKTFAEFGVDYLKYDFCYMPFHTEGPLMYRRMGMALKASGREILFSACNWGSDEVEKWIRSTGAHIYRSTGDIFDNFKSMSDIAISQIDKLPYSAPGCYNDIDMLVCGMYDRGNVAQGGMNDDEYLFHFALWCAMQSPLMIGCDVRNMSEATLKTLTNKELIRLDQDEEARPLFPVTGKYVGEAINGVAVGSLLIGFKHLSGSEYLIAAFNFDDKPAFIGQSRVNFADIGLPFACGHGLRLKDIMTGEEVFAREFLSIPLEARSFKLFRGTCVPV